MGPPPTADPVPVPPTADAGVTVSVSEGSVARYLIGEQLARNDLPNDAVGETPDVSGSVVFNSDGSIDSERSVVTVGLAGLTSDASRRDRYVRERVFDTANYPDAVLTVQEVVRFPWPLPTSGEASFLLIGDLKIRDETNVVKWDVLAQFSDGMVSAAAKAVVTFDYLGISKPSFAFILSVDDEIRLELDIEAVVSSN